jgi:redox-sensitive bicupin YhaK (pirin superfamily)
MKNEIEFIIDPRAKDIGIEVRRLLPWVKKRMVGPFIFLDHMGPSHLKSPLDHLDVRPHPHIGLSTLTYLFEGEIFHRDSLGYKQLIVPGEVNWMTAGKGISHSERERPEMRKINRTIHGLQFWVALPIELEDCDPSFTHYSQDEIPMEENPSHHIAIVAGSRNGKTSPLKALSPMTFQVVKAKQEGSYTFSEKDFELALYVIHGEVKINHQAFTHEMVTFKQNSSIELTHSQDALFAVIGGKPFPEKRFIWWNLVSSSEEKIEATKKAWSEGTFPMVPDETEFIPLPKD